MEMGSPTTEALKRRRARMMKHVLELAEQLNVNDGELAIMLGVNRPTVARYYAGHPPKNCQAVSKVLAELRERAGLPGPKSNGPLQHPVPPPITPNPITPITSPNEAVSTGMEWKRGYQAGFKDGLEYANQVTLGLAKEEMIR
jgi:hypothetical protein